MKKNRHSIILLSIAIISGLFLASGQSYANSIVTGEDIVNEAVKYEGNRVVMDSAGGVQWIYDRVGIQLPGTLDELNQAGAPVSKGEQLQLGDIVLLGTISQEIVSVASPEGEQFIYEKLGIELPDYLNALWAILLVEIDVKELIVTGIYMGDNRFIISHNPYGSIRIFELNSSEWQYLGARRVVEKERPDPIDPVALMREKVIQEGLKYLGTPYEYNSSRLSTETMDCSDFVRRTYYDATGEWIASNSRTQFSYVQQYGKVITRWEDLQSGDLIFFIDDTGKISHVAIFMGDNQILHATVGNGVHIGHLTSYWMQRAYRGGNLLD